MKKEIQPVEAKIVSNFVTVTDGIVFNETPRAKTFETELKYNPLEFITSDNTEYNSHISQLSILLATDLYAHCGVTFKGEKIKVEDCTTLYEKLGFKDPLIVELKKQDFVEDWNDLTAAAFSHQEYVVNGKNYSIIFAVIRGTDATYEQWSSNFDIGAESEEQTKKHPDWKNKNNHKGMDVAANRINEKLIEYLEQFTDFEDTSKIILFTGQSRGAGIANILGAMYEANLEYKTFTYTFGGPRTTCDKTKADSIKTVFNLINEDDIVPSIPVEKWGFCNYGKDIVYSLSKHSKEWKALVGVKYRSAKAFLSKSGQDKTGEAAWMSNISPDRKSLYLIDNTKKNRIHNLRLFYSRKYIDSAITNFDFSDFSNNFNISNLFFSCRVCPNYTMHALSVVITFYTNGGLKNFFKISKFIWIFFSRNSYYFILAKVFITAGSFLSDCSLQKSHSITSYYLMSKII